ncbi:hypothetical protein DEM27_10675 [Metarhizobium album]|uniref:Uncharacterized protein n=2 Tax=Metarhizobium album TaxID=2182425 RepID=A0A2U2DRH2_9HYPH|nr:hypothetical protein DEM27_10675 [Rhizobium album]
MIKKSELNRMADVANDRGVTVWVEFEGRRYGVTPPAATPPLDDTEESDLDRELEAFKAKNGYR